MSRLLLLADSNFTNNIGVFAGRKIKDLEVKSCQSRKAALAEISMAEEGIVVVSCLDMIAADIIATTTNPSDAGRAIEVYYNQLLFKLVEKVDEAEGKMAFGVVAPLFWSSLNEEAKRSMNHTYKLMKASSLQNIWFTDYLKEVRAGADGTHLTQRSATHYIQRIHDLFGQVAEATGLGPVVLLAPEQPEQSGSLNLAPATASNWAEDVTMQDNDAVVALGPPDSEESDVAPTRSTTMLSASMLLQPSRQVTMLPSFSSGPALEDTQSRLIRLAAYPDLTVPPPGAPNRIPLQPAQSSLASLERRVQLLEDTTFHNNLMMAALKEEQDTEANKAMLNRVTFSGVVIDGLQTMSEANKVAAMKEKVMEIVDILKDADQVFELLFVRHLNSQIRGQKSAVIEAKFADSKQTKDLRTKFVEKHKGLGLKFNITPVVRVATRVRVEMMHSISNLLLRHDKSVVKAMCVQFIPKPVIKIIRKTMGGTEISRTMTFTESIIWIRENGLERSLDLVKARSRAGASLRATLAQHFVLMD